MSTRNIPWSKGGRRVGLTTLPPSCADCLEIWEPQSPRPSGPVQACHGIALPLPLHFVLVTADKWMVLAAHTGEAVSHKLSSG